jgi:hypothetical protein
MISLADQALSQLGSVYKNKRKPKASPARIFMNIHKDLIEDMIKKGGTTTTITEALTIPPSCFRKNLARVCGAEIKALCKANGELASASNAKRRSVGFNVG